MMLLLLLLLLLLLPPVCPSEGCPGCSPVASTSPPENWPPFRPGAPHTQLLPPDPVAHAMHRGRTAAQGHTRLAAQA
jgi:hypothetical protein